MLVDIFYINSFEICNTFRTSSNNNMILNLNVYSANTNKKLIYLWHFTISTVQCPEYLKVSKICYEVLEASFEKCVLRRFLKR